MRSNQPTLVAATIGLFRILAVCIPVLMLPNSATAQGEEEGKKIPGYKGETELDKGAGKNTYWYDSGDGIDPGSAGCHIEVERVDEKTIRRTDRVFGEECTADGLLVETTPGPDEIHRHVNDIGHPYLFDCDVWCKSKHTWNRGTCEPTIGPRPCATSAVCVCWTNFSLGWHPQSHDFINNRQRWDFLITSYNSIPLPRGQPNITIIPRDPYYYNPLTPR